MLMFFIITAGVLEFWFLSVAAFQMHLLRFGCHLYEMLAYIYLMHSAVMLNHRCVVSS